MNSVHCRHCCCKCITNNFFFLFTVTITDPNQPKIPIPIPSIDLDMSTNNEEMQKMHIIINTESDEPPDDVAPKMYNKNLN